MKLANPGRPSEAREPAKKTAAATGILWASPPRRLISRVPAEWWMTPHIMNSTAVMSPWVNICKTAALMPIADNVAAPSITKPMWLMLE